MTLLSALLTLLLVMDPIGNIPLVLSCVKDLPPSRRRRVIVREVGLACALLVAFLVAGQPLLGALQLRTPALTLAGAILLFLIAIRLIFPPRGGLFGELPEGEPLLFPIATPAIAGPSSLALVLLFPAVTPQDMLQWVLVIVVACAITGGVLLLAGQIQSWLGRRGIIAIERLTGMLLTAIAVQLFIDGLAELMPGLQP